MIGWILAVVALAGVGLWLATRRRVAPRPAKAAAVAAADLTPDQQLVALRRAGNIWGVQLAFPPGQGCTAAREVQDTKYDLDRAPRLPLRGCDAPRCRCRYLPLRERRRRDVLPPEGDDRRNTGQVHWDIHKS